MQREHHLSPGVGSPIWKRVSSDRERVSREAVASIMQNEAQLCLDLGTGCGEMAKVLAEHSCQVVAVDRSGRALDAARSRVIHAGVTFVQADGTALPFIASYFHGVVCFESLHHFMEPFRALDEVNRVLRPGGILAIVEQTDHAKNVLSHASDVLKSVSHSHPTGDFTISQLFDEVCRRFQVEQAIHSDLEVLIVARKDT